MLSVSAMVYIMVLCAGWLATLYISPFYGVLLYVIEYLVNPPARWWYSGLPHWRYSFIIMALVLLSYLLRKSQFSENRFLALPQGKWLTLMAAVVVITSLWAVDRELHAAFTVRYLKVLLFVILAFKVTDTARKFEALMGAYLLGTGYLSFLIWQTGRTGSGRLEGIGCADSTDANGTAALLSTVVPLLVFYALFTKNRWLQLACATGLAFTLNGLILLNSRGAYLALVASMAYFCLLVFREKGLRGQKAKIVAGVLAAACLFLYLADEVFWTRMATIKEVGASAELETHNRVDYWMVTPEMLKQHPLGGGARTYHVLSPHYLPAEWLTGGKRAVHSMWFEVMSEYGYHGFCIFLGYVLSVSRLARKVRKHLIEQGDSYHAFQSAALEASWISMLIAATFINFFYGELTYWLPMFIAAFANIHLYRFANAPLQNLRPVQNGSVVQESFAVQGGSAVKDGTAAKDGTADIQGSAGLCASSLVRKLSA